MIVGRALLSDEVRRKDQNFGDSSWQAGVLLYYVSYPSDSWNDLWKKMRPVEFLTIAKGSRSVLIIL